MMGKRRATVYACDAPGCRVERVVDGAGSLPIGYFLKVHVEHNTGGYSVDVYACAIDHVSPATQYMIEVGQ